MNETKEERLIAALTAIVLDDMKNMIIELEQQRDALLEACIRLIALEQGQRFVTYEDIDLAKAAIARAKGEA